MKPIHRPPPLPGATLRPGPGPLATQQHQPVPGAKPGPLDLQGEGLWGGLSFEGLQSQIWLWPPSKVTLGLPPSFTPSFLPLCSGRAGVTCRDRLRSSCRCQLLNRVPGGSPSPARGSRLSCHSSPPQNAPRGDWGRGTGAARGTAQGRCPQPRQELSRGPGREERGRERRRSRAGASCGGEAGKETPKRSFGGKGDPQECPAAARGEVVEP